MRCVLLILCLIAGQLAAAMAPSNPAFVAILARASSTTNQWNPSNEGTVLVNLDAATVSLPNNTATNTWPDSSGNSYHAKQSTSGFQPLFKTAANGINTNAAFYFDGSDDYLVLSNIFGTVTAATAFIVLQSDNNTFAQIHTPWDATGSGDFDWFPYTGGSGLNDIYEGLGSTTRRSSSVTNNMASGERFILCVSTAANDYHVYLDASEKITDSSNTVNWGSIQTLSNSGSSKWNGLIAHFILYDGVLGSTARGNVFTNLKARYGTR